MKLYKHDPVWISTECLGKHRYENNAIAKKVADRQRARKDVKVSPYHCNICHGYHVGTQKPKRLNVTKKRDNEKLTRSEHE